MLFSYEESLIYFYLILCFLLITGNTTENVDDSSIATSAVCVFRWEVKHGV